VANEEIEALKQKKREETQDKVFPRSNLAEKEEDDVDSNGIFLTN
jgi:hypothetical protein